MIMNAQAAVAEHADLKGTVAYVETRDLFRAPDVSPTRQGYHWNGNAETYFLMGIGMGEAMKKLCGKGSARKTRR
jgi:alpha-galactosidase